MDQPNAGRKIAHIISRNSNWRSDAVTRFFKTQDIYAGRQKWTRFLKIFLLSTGMAFCATGIFFFFAYNWASMHPFAKLGIIQGLILCLVLPAVFLKSPLFVKQILITAVSLMVGLLFAVFGQIYQTGADTYDFFLAWTIFITIWVFVADFAALWLVYVVLLNTTVYFFFEQDINTWLFNARCNIHFALNMLLVICFLWLSQKKFLNPKPAWLVQSTALAAIVFLTLSIITGIYDKVDIHLSIAIVNLLLFYPLLIMYGMRTKSLFWIGTICFSLIAIAAALFIKPFDDVTGIFLFVSAFIIGSTSLLIYQLLQLKKKWSDEN